MSASSFLARSFSLAVACALLGTALTQTAPSAHAQGTGKKIKKAAPAVPAGDAPTPAIGDPATARPLNETENYFRDLYNNQAGRAANLATFLDDVNSLNTALTDATVVKPDLTAGDKLDRIAELLKKIDAKQFNTILGDEDKEPGLSGKDAEGKKKKLLEKFNELREHKTVPLPRQDLVPLLDKTPALTDDLPRAVKAAKEALNTLHKTLGKADTAPQKLLEALTNRLTELDGALDSDDPMVLRPSLAASLKTYDEVLVIRRTLSEKIPLPALDGLDGKIAGIAAKLPLKLARLTAEEGDLRASATLRLESLGKNGVASDSNAQSFSKLTAPVVADNTAIGSLLLPIISDQGQLLTIKDSPFKTKYLNYGATITGLETETNSFRTSLVSLAALNEQIAARAARGNSYFAEERIRLFNRDDIQRVLQLAAGNGSKVTQVGSGSQSTADISATNLQNAAQEVVKQRQKLADARTALATTRERLDAAQAKKDNADAALRDRKRVVLGAQQAGKDADFNQSFQSSREQQDISDAQADLARTKARQALAESEQSDAETALKTKPDDATLLARQSTAKADLRRYKEQAIEQQHTVDTLTAQKTQRDSAGSAAKTASPATPDTADAQATVDGLKADIVALQTKVESAQTGLATASDDFATKASAAYLAALVDNRDFARNRDSAPLFIVTADPSSPDPIARVQMSGFADERTIVLRGDASDLSIARRLIAKLDRPEAQAMMRLWTVEVTGGTNKGGTQGISDVLQEFQNEIDSINNDTEKRVSLLRNAINKAAVDASRTGEFDFYDPEVLRLCGLQRIHSAPDELKLMRNLLPDARNPSSLVRSLVIFSLARPEIQKRILADVTTGGVEINSASTFKGFKTGKAAGDTTSPNWTGEFERFHRFAWFGDGPSVDLISFRDELIAQMRRRSVDTFTDYLLHLTAARDKTVEIGKNYDAESKKLPVQLAELGKQTPPDTQAILKITQRIALLPDLQKQNTVTSVRIKKQMVNVVKFLFLSLGVMNTDTFTLIAETASSAQLQGAVDELVRSSPNYTQYVNSHSSVLDAKLYAFLGAVNYDISRGVRERLQQLRSDLNTIGGKSVSVGILQETDVLTSNRVIARIDPSAYLSTTPQTQSVNDDVQGLASLLSLAGQVGRGVALGGTETAVTGLLGNLTGGGNPNPGARALGSTGGTQNAKTSYSGVYGITTGNTFQVTPIFDPSGEGMRFKFDFVAASQVHEPNDTTDPQVSRIERVSTNTEVRLKNQELKIISQYETNARLGKPATHNGGLPILKDIPLIREIPLIGWFSRSSSAQAQTAYHLVFTKTTMYPGVEDIIDLIVRPVARPGEE